MAGAAVKLPAIGEVPRNYVYAGGALVAGVVGMAYFRRAVGGGTGDPVAAEDPSGVVGDYAAGQDTYDNPAPATITTPAEVDPDSLPPANNAAWVARAVDRLGDVGYDPQAVAAACGRYLGRQPLASQAEVDLMRTAVAMCGPPPTGEYSLIAPTPGSTSAPAASTPVALASPQGLRVKSVAGGNVHLDWTKVPGAKAYLITASGAGATVTRTVTATGGYVTKLRPSTAYHFNVRAVDGKGTKGPASGSVSATTKRK